MMAQRRCSQEPEAAAMATRRLILSGNDLMLRALSKKNWWFDAKSAGPVSPSRRSRPTISSGPRETVQSSGRSRDH